MISSVTIKGGIDFAAVGRELPGAMSQSLATGIIFWRSEYLEEHFTLDAYQKYNYQKRQVKNSKGRAGYSMIKMKVKHHNRPLVWSGESERQIRQFMEVETSDTKVRAKGKLKAPRHFFIRKPINMNKAEEVTRVTDSETQNITDEIRWDFMQRHRDIMRDSQRSIVL